MIQKLGRAQLLRVTSLFFRNQELARVCGAVLIFRCLERDCYPGRVQIMKFLHILPLAWNINRIRNTRYIKYRRMREKSYIHLILYRTCEYGEKENQVNKTENL
jgi:hypothetical protein